MTRVCLISADPASKEDLRAAVLTALDYAIAAIGRSAENEPPVPVILLAQARTAARDRTGLDIVLRRYCSSYSLFTDLLVDIAAEIGLGANALKGPLQLQARLLDRLLTAVSEEYMLEARNQDDSAELRRARRVERLLKGELVDASELSYPFEDVHLGLIALGAGFASALRDMASSLDYRLLAVARGDGPMWAWVGSRCPPDPAKVQRLLTSAAGPDTFVAIGEPSSGLAGWRLTHRQAAAAVSVALSESRSFVRYADIAVLASALQDELLTTSLSRIYLHPLEDERDRGETAKQTLRAYFAAHRSISSAAAALGVSRQTVARRLQAIERRLGRPVAIWATQMEIALRLEGGGKAEDTSDGHRLYRYPASPLPD